jgi:FkbM family methyltransferase
VTQRLSGVPEEGASLSGAEPVPQRRGLRSWLRKPAKLLYRGVVPLVRPLAFRLRRYLLDGLTDSTREIVRQETQSVYGLLRQEISNAHTWSHEQRQKVSLSILQELQASQSFLHENLDSRHREVIEMLREAAGLTQSYEALVPRLRRIEAYGYAAARRFALNCGDDTVMVRTEVGYLLCAASDHAVLACLIDSGDLERGTRLLIESILRPGDTFVDVGANIGMHTLAAARAMQQCGRIFAFEPMPSTANLLARSLWLNGLGDLVRLERRAAFDQSGTRRLFLGATSGLHSLFPLSSTPERESTIKVEMIRLDDVLRDVPKVDLIKLDVEGAELEALAGARETIQRNPDIALIVELGLSHLRRVGHSVEDWLGRFEDLGLVARAIDPLSGKLGLLDRQHLDELSSVNLLFARPGTKVLDTGIE